MPERPKLTRAFDSPETKLAYNRRLFATIAPRYDLITRLLSYGQDARWKRRVVEIARAEGPPGRALDLACGTGDIALALAAHGRDVVGLDLTMEMLIKAEGRRQGAEGRDKSEARRSTGEARRSTVEAGPRWTRADMTRLPFPDASFAVVTVGYGLRNVPDLSVAIDEIARVLAPGGLLVSLDFNKPDSRVMRAIYLGYLTAVGSTLGLALHGNADAYRYIPHSIRRYPGARGVAARLSAGGFADVRIEPRLGGLMTIHAARRAGI